MPDVPDVRSKADAIALLKAMAKAKQRHGDARRAGAYSRAAQALERTSEDFTELIAHQRLRSLPGIGESIESTITIFALTGETPEWLGAVTTTSGGADDEALMPDAPKNYHAAPFQGAPDLHCHTTWSDGTLDLEDVVLLARKLGERAIGISDHSGSLGIARGLKPNEVREQWAAIDSLQQKHPDILILKGTECDILRNGRLDHPDEILDGFDYVIASLHSQLKLPLADQTERVLRALDDPHLTILGHPTTRVPGRRPRANLDLAKVFEKAAVNEVALEVNGNPGRLDLDEELALQALQAGARLSLGSDGHSAWEMLALENARRIAGKAGARAEDIANFDVLTRVAKSRGVPLAPPSSTARATE
jgi:histidinol phosphatase-like PHP family hydrolase